jgi:RHS repeat-associated protein
MLQNQLKYSSKYPQSFTGKTCSPLLHYHCVNHANSCGNAIANSLGLLHAETGFSCFGARYYDSDILTGWLSVDPMADKYPNISPYAYCAWNPVKLVDPDGRDWYQSDDGSTLWVKGNETYIEKDAVKYKNIGEYYTEIKGDYAISYYQNKPTHLTTFVLKNSDFETQRDSRTNSNKPGQEGNCFVQSGKMVAHSGTISEETPRYNITNIQEGIDYAAHQVANGPSTRVHVDRNGDNKGDHWVAISSCTIEIKSQKPVAFGFFDPGTAYPEKGTKGWFTVQNGVLSGLCPYNSKIYNVTDIRSNKP